MMVLQLVIWFARSPALLDESRGLVTLVGPTQLQDCRLPVNSSHLGEATRKLNVCNGKGPVPELSVADDQVSHRPYSEVRPGCTANRFAFWCLTFQPKVSDNLVDHDVYHFFMAIC